MPKSASACPASERACVIVCAWKITREWERERRKERYLFEIISCTCTLFFTRVEWRPRPNGRTCNKYNRASEITRLTSYIILLRVTFVSSSGAIHRLLIACSGGPGEVMMKMWSSGSSGHSGRMMNNVDEPKMKLFTKLLRRFVSFRRWDCKNLVPLFLVSKRLVCLFVEIYLKYIWSIFFFFSTWISYHLIFFGIFGSLNRDTI